MDGKPKILIASILKPVDDVRLYYKFGQSLAQTNKYEVNIIGFVSKKALTDENIKTYPIFFFGRLSIKRVFAPIKFLVYTIKVKPKVLIVSTPELLIVSLLYKIIFGSKIIYDVQENYTMNVTYGTNYPPIVKQLIKNAISLSEWVSSYFIDYYFLAEKVYQQQLKFIRNRPAITILNKAIKPIDWHIKGSNFMDKSKAIKLIISGTIGDTYGTLSGIEFFQQFKKHYRQASLTIIGYSANSSFLREVKHLCQSDTSIKLITANVPINHKHIIEEIKKSDLALMPYELNDNLSSRIPTKLYEYLAYGVPMLIPNNAQWLEILNTHKAGFAVDFVTPNMADCIINLITIDLLHH